MKNFISIIVLVGLIINVQAKSYDISLNLEKGQSYAQKMVSDMTITQTFNGQEMKINMVINGDMDFLVKNVSEDVFDIEVKYTSLGIKMDMPQMKMEFSSGQPINDSINDLMALMFNNLVGKTFEMKLDKKGKVNEVIGLEAILTSLLEGLPEVSEDKKQQFTEQINSSFGEDAIRTSLEQQTAIFPEKPVKVGESWTKESAIKSTMDFEMSSTYVLEGVEKDVYIIKSTATMNVPKADNFEQKNGVYSKTELSGTSTKETKVQITSGWVTSSTETQKISGNIFMKMTEDGEIVTMPMNIVGITEITN